MKPDCLIALDTLGVKHNAMILGIAVLRFDLERPDLLPDEFYFPVDVASNALLNRRVEAGGLEHWTDRLDMEYVFAADPTKLTLQEALQRLTKAYEGKPRLWVFGRGFEAPMLSDAYQQCGMEAPWDYWSISCARTFIETAQWLNNEHADPETHGNNLCDTNRMRLSSLKRAYGILNGRRVPT